MKNRILVTGGLGYIGSHTVVELHNGGFVPVIIDNLSNSCLSVLDGITAIIKHQPTFYEDNFADIKLLNNIVKKHKISGVIHFAACKAVGESIEYPLKYYQNNVAGFVSLLNKL